MVDLHTHSTASDGTFSPTELVAAAAAAGLSAVALTDHDTLDGLAAFSEAGVQYGIKTIPGVEIACSWYQRTVHLVGLFVDSESVALRSLLARVRDNRGIRNEKILTRLAELGIDLDVSDLLVYAKGESIGRPHIAQALVAHGYADDVPNAFDALLGRGAAAYVRRYLPLPPEAIGAIHAAGGVAVWAHPFGGAPKGSAARIRQPARSLMRSGLDGIEVYYSEHSTEQETQVAQIAQQLGLLASGGSDFHGENMVGIKLGIGHGNLCVPDELASRLAARASARA